MKFFEEKVITISFIERLGLFIGSLFLSLCIFAIGLGAFMTQNNSHEIIGGFLIISSVGLLFFNTIALHGYGMARNNSK